MSILACLLAALSCSVNEAVERSPSVVVYNASSYAQLERLAKRQHKLHWHGSKAMVTLADNATAAQEALCRPSCSVPLLILETGTPWPGNLYKIVAFRSAALALPAKTVVFFTDCCDVLFLPSPAGAANIFDKFSEKVASGSTSHLAGAEVVIGVERGFHTITREGTHFIKSHDHWPAEFPGNRMEAAAGVVDACDHQQKMCLQSKMPSSGVVLGYAQSLAKMYDGACNKDSQCEEWERMHGNVSLDLTSDQNVLTHYLLKSSFKSGSSRIALDTDMDIFHVTAGFTAKDYSFRDGRLEVILPGTARASDIGASVVHVPGRKSSSTSVSILSRLQDLVALSQSSTSSTHRHRFLASGHKRAVMEESQQDLQPNAHLVLKPEDHTML